MGFLDRWFGRRNPEGKPHAKEISASKPAEVSAEDRQKCLLLIRANRYAGPKEQEEPFCIAEMPEAPASGNRRFYVEFEDPETLAEGTIYHEWVVTFPRTGEPVVFCGRARRRNGGCDTLPPEDWDEAAKGRD